MRTNRSKNPPVILDETTSAQASNNNADEAKKMDEAEKPKFKEIEKTKPKEGIDDLKKSLGLNDLDDEPDSSLYNSYTGIEEGSSSIFSIHFSVTYRLEGRHNEMHTSLYAKSEKKAIKYLREHVCDDIIIVDIHEMDADEEYAERCDDFYDELDDDDEDED